MRCTQLRESLSEAANPYQSRASEVAKCFSELCAVMTEFDQLSGGRLGAVLFLLAQMQLTSPSPSAADILPKTSTAINLLLAASNDEYWSKPYVTQGGGKKSRQAQEQKYRLACVRLEAAGFDQVADALRGLHASYRKRSCNG